MLVGTPAGDRRAYARCAAGLLPQRDDIPLWLVVTNAVDPSQAPDGQDSLYVYTPTMPVDPDDGWKFQRQRPSWHDCGMRPEHGCQRQSSPQGGQGSRK